MFTKFFKRRLASCLCFVLAATCIVSSLPPGITGGGYQVSAAEQHERNWALGASYEMQYKNHHDYDDPDFTKLTDGQYTNGYTNTLLVFGCRWDTGYITMDLGHPRTLSRVVISGYEQQDIGIGIMPEILVEYYDEEAGDWKLGTTWNNSPHFTGNKNDGPGIGYGSYKEERDVNFTASRIRFTLKGMENGWISYDEIELYGPVDETIPSIPIFEQNLSRDKGVALGGETSLSVSLKPMEIGMGTITYDWYKDGVKIEGVDSDTLTITDAAFEDAGSYHVVVTNTIGDLTETVTSNTCSLVVQEASKDSLLYGIPFTTSMTYGDANKGEGNYIERDPSMPAATMLTDGMRSDGNVGSIYTAYYNKGYGSLSYADFVFDMGEMKQFEQLNLSTLGGASGIFGPSRFQVYISSSAGEEPTWKLIHDVELAEDLGVHEYIYKTNGGKIAARQIKINVFFSKKQLQNWIGLDEIELLQTADGREPDGIFSTGGYVPADKDNIVSWGKTYSVNKNSEDDPDLIALTDGRTGDELLNNWINYPASSGNLEVVIDLGAATAFEQVDANFLYNAEGAARWPQWIRAEYSNDGSNWKSVGQVDLGSPAADETEIAHGQIVAEQTISARYVKLTVPNSDAIALDDVMVLKYKTLIVAPQDPDVTVDPNNLAYGRPYTTAWPANASYPDGNYKLTNGKRGRLAYNDPEWVGYHMNDGKKEGLTDFYVTIDLGSVQSFEQVKVGSLRQQGPGISSPTAMKVEYSSDMQNWTTLSDDALNYEGDSVNRYVATADKAISGRYVRVHIVGVSWFFIDEIEVLQVADANPDANENPDYGAELNLLRGNNTYTISQKPAINNLGGLLTDGKYGVTYTQYDQNWMGFTTPGHVVMDFDLRALSSVSQIIVSSRKDSGNKQTIPENLTIFASSNGVDWINLASLSGVRPADGENVNLTWDASVNKFPNPYFDDAEYAYIRYIRVEFDVPAGGNAVYLDEVKAIGKLGQCSKAGTPYILDEDGSRNLAMGTSYTYFPEGATNSYSDATMTRLTDGVQGSASFGDGKWVGFNRTDCAIAGDIIRSAKQIRSIIVDLNDLKTIKSVTYGNAVNKGAGIPNPANTKLFVSVDGEKWLPMTKSTSAGKAVPDGRYTYGWHNEDISENGATIIDLLPENEMIIARYVRLEVEVTGWTFVDEITVQGYDELKSGVAYADNGTVALDGQFLQTGENTGDVQDMVLCYTGWYGFDAEGGEAVGDLTLTKLRPLLTYIDENNKAVDTMFDTVLLLALKSQYGRYYADSSQALANATDWHWFMDKTFDEGGDMDTLNEAARIASGELNDPNYKVKMVLMYPTAYNKEQPKFGSLDGERNLTFRTEDDYDYALNWWINEALSRFEAGNYEYIDFVGFYWLHEGADDVVSEQRIMKFNDAVHEKGMKTYWIPYWNASGTSSAHNYGFDATALQPNHFFTYRANQSAYLPGTMAEPVKNGNPLMDTFAFRIKTLGLGAEFEIEGDAFTQAIKYNVFLDYLNNAEKHGYDGPGVYRNWYLDRPFAQSAYSGNAVVRSIYEYSYQLMKGTYTQKEYIDPKDFPTDPDFGGLWRGDGVTGGGSIGGGSGSGGGGSVTPKPDDKPDPETPPTGDDNYTWEETDNGYKLKDADGEYVTGWAKVSGKWYYLNADGIRATGWQKVDNKWYYLKTDGVMATGWLKLGNTWYFLNAGGVMQTGWLYNGGV